MQVTFDQGSLKLTDCPRSILESLPDVIVNDARMSSHRAEARHYRDILLEAKRMDVSVDDMARSYSSLSCELRKPIVPRTHQKEALDAWCKRGFAGVVSLPTGAGKTILAILALVRVKRSTLVVVPTIDLMEQWVVTIRELTTVECVGRLGGGHRDVQDITVATYDSARLTIERIGGQFGLLVFDECHHLPAETNRFIAQASIAPFRLGLSATLQRADGGEAHLAEMVGPTVFDVGITDVAGTVLAPYDVVTVEVSLTDEERVRYESARRIYTEFLRRHGIRMGDAMGWKTFIMRSAQSHEGREAFKAYLAQKKLAQASSEKMVELWRLISAHPGESTIIFTDSNDLAYQIGERFILPVLTHKTRSSERSTLLEHFKSRKIDVIVTSKVLNEGVDIPTASVGIVVSGSGAVREHVQRLGRLLRRSPGKRSVLYEMVSADTSERYVNLRRRQHDAYQGTP